MISFALACLFCLGFGYLIGLNIGHNKGYLDGVRRSYE